MESSIGEGLSEAVFDLKVVGIAQVDLTGNWIRINQKFCDILGYSHDELLRLTFQNLSHPEDIKVDEGQMRRLLGGEIQTFTIEKRYIHKAGYPLWINLTVSLGSNPSHAKPAWMLYVLEDITARKMVELSLREKDAFLKTIYHGVDEAIFVIDAGTEDGFNFVACNPAYARLTKSFGVDIDQIMGHSIDSFRRFFPEEAIQHLKMKYRQCLQSHQSMEYEESVPIDGKLTHWITRLTPLHDPNGKANRIVGTSTNITYQRETIAKVRETEDHLRQAQKMEAVGRLAGGIAHDFNNLLTAINGYGDLLLSRIPHKGTEYDFILEIRKAGERAATLTHQLLAFSRKQVLSAKNIDLNGVVLEMGKLLKRLIGADIALETRLAEDLGPILADRGQIEQVILNLALNARDALPDGGRLSIETAKVEIGDGTVGLENPIPSGSYVLLTVSDTGKGMDKETRSRIFEPFFTTKPTGEGTGLGLSTVYGIVTQSGGHIQVYSEPGHGAVFKVYLPLAAATGRESSYAPKPDLEKGLGGGETILVAEDEDTLGKLIAKILTSNGYNVLSAHNGKEALRLAEEFPGTIHLLLTDVIMGQMGGRELSEELLKRKPEMKLIYMSGYTDDTVVRHGILGAKNEFLQKPFSPSALLRRIREVLDSVPV